jgi:hypothetical protein
MVRVGDAPSRRSIGLHATRSATGNQEGIRPMTNKYWNDLFTVIGTIALVAMLFIIPG